LQIGETSTEIPGRFCQFANSRIETGEGFADLQTRESKPDKALQICKLANRKWRGFRQFANSRIETGEASANPQTCPAKDGRLWFFCVTFVYKLNVGISCTLWGIENGFL
jgi:hypothetical protein